MTDRLQADGRKQVAFVVTSSVLGGHEFQTAELVKLAQAYCAVTVFVNKPEHAPLFEASGSDVVIADGLFHRPGKLHAQIARGLRCMKTYRRLFRDFDRVVVCAGAVEAAVPVGLGLLSTGKADLYLPFIYDRTVLWGYWGKAYTCLLRLLTKLFTNLITVNRIQARLISGSHKGKVRFIRNKIATLRPLEDRAEPRRLVTIGRLDSQKRIVELIQDVDYPANPFAELLVIGDGPLRARVEEAARHARFIKVTVLGWLDADQQSRLLSRGDILVLHSVIEGEPMVIREANARGMVVIARDIPGVRGVTWKANRYKSVAELRDRLKQAHEGKLRVFPAEDVDRLNLRRENAARKLFA